MHMAISPLQNVHDFLLTNCMVANGIGIGEEGKHHTSNELASNGDGIVMVFAGQAGQKDSWPPLQFNRNTLQSLHA